MTTNIFPEGAWPDGLFPDGIWPNFGEGPAWDGLAHISMSASNPDIALAAEVQLITMIAEV